MSDVYADDEGTTCVLWDLEDFIIPDGLNPVYFYNNVSLAVKHKMGFTGDMRIWFYHGGKLDMEEDFVKEYEDLACMFFSFWPEADKYERPTRMIRDALLLAADNREIAESTIFFIVSNKFSGSEEETKVCLSYLQALESRKYNILLSLKEAESFGPMFPCVSFEWLWQRILGGSGEPGFDLCSCCGNAIHK